ncbi:MAG TPA: maleylpyruvate isomerase N-terminal domain-containing protein [Candidatus Limnocylindrales bacterium]|nr:maleylpyruvate isomerase N-terminal domain-containing protein [Candidatus Limnocylindrales bacterium]
MTESTSARDRVVAQIRNEQQACREVVAEVGEQRMNEPGPMGDWSFRDLAAHLLGWRERTLSQLEAVAAGREAPPDPWPADLGDDDDAVNDWIQRESEGRATEEILADIDGSFDRLAAALGALPEEALTDPAGLAGFEEGGAAAEMDWVSHWHEEHEPDVRAWLSSASAPSRR